VEELVNDLIYISRVTDPYFNLALENHLLLNFIENERILLVYENSPSVIIGRFQNPWIECNLPRMFEDNVLLVRRQSGGGTVYHDSGNLNFSFIADKKHHNKDYNHAHLLRALEKVGVHAKSTIRGDLRLVEDASRKISGSAFKEKKDSSFHHGTMLIDTDLDLLNMYINSDKKDLATKSIASIRSIVANLSEINPLVTKSNFTEALVDEFKVLQMQKVCEVTYESKIYQILLDSEYYNELKSKSWLYLQTPQFQVNEDINWAHIQLTVKKTKIVTLDIHINDVHPSLEESIKEALVGSSIFDVQEKLSGEIFEYDNIGKRLYSWFELYFSLDALP
jgi:lipoate-protein ligase A